MIQESLLELREVFSGKNQRGAINRAPAPCRAQHPQARAKQIADQAQAPQGFASESIGRAAKRVMILTVSLGHQEPYESSMLSDAEPQDSQSQR
jgi:hypothetical protein